MQWIVTVTLVFSFIAGMVIFSRNYGRQPSPRSFQRIQRRNFYIILLLSCFFLPLLISQHQFFGLRCWIVMIGTLAYTAFRNPTEKQLQVNYAVDPIHCGRCSYDLTGNVSGTCPECGWAIPSSLPTVESQTWGMWWKRWDIEYLENWRKTLATVVTFTILFSLMTVCFLWWTSIPTAVMSAIMSVQFIINTVRAMQYARKHRPPLPLAVSGTTDPIPSADNEH